MFQHSLNKARLTKDGSPILTKGIYIKDSGAPAAFIDTKRTRKADPRLLARLRREANRLLGLN